MDNTHARSYKIMTRFQLSFTVFDVLLAPYCRYLDVHENYTSVGVEPLCSPLQYLKKYDTALPKQFLINYTSTSYSLNFGMIVVIIFWLLQNLSNLDLNVLVDSACTTPLGRLVQHFTSAEWQTDKKQAYAEKTCENGQARSKFDN